MPPWFVWKVLFPLQEKIKGHTTFEIQRQMEQADRMTPSGLEQHQARLLGGLIQYGATEFPAASSNSTIIESAITCIPPAGHPWAMKPLSRPP